MALRYLLSTIVILAIFNGSQALTAESNQKDLDAFVYGLIQSTFMNTFDKIKLPAIPDPFEIDSWELGQDNELFKGTVRLCGAKLTGQKDLDVDMVNTPQPGGKGADVKLDISVPNIKLTGKHDIIDGQAKVDKEFKKLVGSGNVDAHIQKPVALVDLKIKLKDQGEFEIEELGLHISFSCLAINLQGTKLDGKELDWAVTSKALKTQFDAFWKKNSKLFSKNILLPVARMATKGCKFTDLSEGKFDCIKFPGIEFGNFGTKTAAACPAGNIFGFRRPQITAVAKCEESDDKGGKGKENDKGKGKGKNGSATASIQFSAIIFAICAMFKSIAL